MTASAVFFVVIGISLTFAADWVVTLLNIHTNLLTGIILQLLGAMYYSFAVLNWMAKGALIGGIYNRPILMANLAHFLIGGLALIKLVMNYHQLPWLIMVMTPIYLLFAFLFGLMMSRHPA